MASLRRFFHSAWFWTDKLLPVAFWIGSLAVFWIGFTLWQETRDNEDATAAVVAELAEEVQRSLVTDCLLGNERSASVIRFWDRFVEFFSGPDTTPEAAARALEFRDRLVIDFPMVDCTDIDVTG